MSWAETTTGVARIVISYFSDLARSVTPSLSKATLPCQPLLHNIALYIIFYTYTHKVARPFDVAAKAGTVRPASWDGMHRTQHKTPHSYTERQIERQKREEIQIGKGRLDKRGEYGEKKSERGKTGRENEGASRTQARCKRYIVIKKMQYQHSQDNYIRVYENNSGIVCLEFTAE